MVLDKIVTMGKSESERPNIFLFVMDTARATSTSAYNEEKENTPFLERCAEEGFKFENAIANSIWTYPSHVSMFTGKYPHEHERLSKVDRGEIFFDGFSNDLSEQGYHTIGLSNNGWLSSVFGFDVFFDDFEMMNDRHTYLFDEAPLLEEFEDKTHSDHWDSGLEKYKDFFIETVKQRRPKSVLNGIHYVLEHKLLSRFGDEDFWSDEGAKDVLKKMRKMDFDSESPKFVFVNFIEPHATYSPPREFAEKFVEGDINRHRELLEKAPHDFLGQDKEKEAGILSSFYDASLNYMDHMLEKIHDEIEENSERENIIIFAGDHGEMFNDKGLWEHHGGFRNEVLTVPLIIKGYEQGEEKQFFELKQLGTLVDNMIKGEDINLGKEDAYSDYLGLDSHMFGDEFPSGYDDPKVAKVTEEGIEEESSLNKADGQIKEHLRSLLMKKNRQNL